MTPITSRPAQTTTATEMIAIVVEDPHSVLELLLVEVEFMIVVIEVDVVEFDVDVVEFDFEEQTVVMVPVAESIVVVQSGGVVKSSWSSWKKSSSIKSPGWLS